MNSHPRTSREAMLAAGVIALLLAVQPASILAQATPFAEGLASPSGIYVDDDGLLWVSGRGTGNNDAGIYVVTPDGEVYPFMTGLPSEIIMGDPEGASHAYINNDVELIVVQGGGSGNVSGTVFTVDTTGFTPGDDPLTPDDINETFPISEFVAGELGPETNPFDITFVPNSDVAYLSDAAANAIVEGNDGGLSILTQFPDVPNMSGQGPAMVDAVPTGVDYFDGTLYVGTLTGFPFNEGAASIFTVDAEGNVSTYLENLTTVVDLQVLPGGDGIVFLEHRFELDAGALYKYENEQLTELATGLDRPAGLRIGRDGEVYVSLFTKGEIVVVEGVVTGSDREIPKRPRLSHARAYPNPFEAAVNLAFDVQEPGKARLTIVDILGRTVHTEEYARLEVGTHRFRWGGETAAVASPGTYLYRLEVAGRTMDGVLVKQ